MPTPNQETQVPNQPEVNPTSTPNSVFDINNLPPEFTRYVDQQRTQASQTASQNARTNLMSDEKFLNEVRGTLQPQVQQTIEEQMADNLRASREERASARVERILGNAGISDEDMPTCLSMLVSEDIDGSVTKANAYVSTLAKAVEGALSKQQQQALQRMPTPQMSTTSVSDQDRLQSLYDEAKKDPSVIRRGTKISQLNREAQEKGITLK